MKININTFIPPHSPPEYLKSSFAWAVRVRKNLDGYCWNYCKQYYKQYCLQCCQQYCWQYSWISDIFGNIATNIVTILVNQQYCQQYCWIIISSVSTITGQSRILFTIKTIFNNKNQIIVWFSGEEVVCKRHHWLEGP